MPNDRESLITVLAGDGLLSLDSGAPHTSRRFRTAMARAALRLFREGEDADDLRIPITLALLDTYGNRLSNEELARRVDLMFDVEVRELAPVLGAKRTS